MSHSILIDIKGKKIVAASKQPNSIKCLSILADILKLPDNYLIIGTTSEGFSRLLSFKEQLEIYNNTTGDEIKRALPDTVLYQCVRIAETFKCDERTSDELEKILGKPFKVSKLPIPERKSSKALPCSIKRPASGTVSAIVWGVCDYLLEKNKKIPSREEVVQKCRKYKTPINDATAATQYGRWKSCL